MLGVAACSGDSFPQSTLHPTADSGRAIDALFTQIFWWAVLVFVVVETALIVTIIRFRARPGRPEPRHVHGNTLVEIAWTLVPAVILIFIAVPTIQTIFRIDGRVPDNALQVEVIGHQWWWEFQYPDLGISTANELHVPQGRPIELVMRSADVIHSFWVPKLHGKRDVMPGRVTRLVFTADSVGTFAGQCAEFCGESHANMRMRVMVDAPADFDVWVAQQTVTVPLDSSDAQQVAGRDLFFRTCIACHQVEGTGGVLGPTLSHLAARTTIAAGILPNDSASLARWIGNPEAVKPGALMQQFPLSEDDIAALVAYLQSRR